MARIMTHILISVSDPDTAGVSLSVLISGLLYSLCHASRLFILVELALNILFSSSPLPLLIMTTDTNRGTLTIVGSGIASIAHITLETFSYIKESDKLFYLVCDPITEAFIQDNAIGDFFDLSVFYGKNKSRYDSFIQMCEVCTATCFHMFCILLIRNKGHVESCQSRS
jgi:hypothetical protein